MRRFIMIAASVLVVSAMIGWLASLTGTTGGSAFARMLAQVANARTVVFKSRAEVGDPPHRMEGKTMLLEPDWIRGEMIENDQVVIHIQNLKERKWLTLLPATKKARLRRSENDSTPQPKNFIAHLREVRESSAEFLGREQINGKETLKYRCEHPSGHYLLWIAPDTNLPVKVVMTESKEGSKALVTLTMSDFEWNPSLDESMFTLNVPDGYQLELDEIVKPVLDPESFIATLKAYVRLNQGAFPDEFNALTPGSMIKFFDDPSLPEKERIANYRRKLANAFDRPDLKDATDEEWQKQGREIGKIMAQGGVFLQVLPETHEWHYLGKGIKLGDADKVVAWWAPKEGKESKSATVLYGDLHLETKSVDGLPR